MPNGAQRYTGVWHTEDPWEGAWMRDMFGAHLATEVIDPERRLVADHVILFEHFAHVQSAEYYRQFRGLDAFLVDLSDEHYKFVPEIYTNFRGVIRPHWSDVFSPEATFFLPLGPTRNYLPQPAKLASDREFLWSFVGGLDKSTRPDMARSLRDFEPHLLFSPERERTFRAWNQTLAGTRRYSPAENSAILADSVFAPSPMGNANLECFRIYEALEAGCIPLLERRWRLDYFRSKYGDHPMPTFRTWGQAQRFVAETMDRPAALNDLQQACGSWWSEYKERCREGLGEFLVRRSLVTEPSTVAQLFKRRHAWPGFSELELLRHHNLRAIARAAGKLVRRMRATGSLRVPHSPAEPV